MQKKISLVNRADIFENSLSKTQVELKGNCRALMTAGYQGRRILQRWLLKPAICLFEFILVN